MADNSPHASEPFSSLMRPLQPRQAHKKASATFMYSRKEGHQRSENPGIHWLAVGSRPGNQRPHLLALRQEPYGPFELGNRRRTAASTQ